MYNPSLRDYLYKHVHIKNENTKFITLSLLPFFLICTVAFLYPYIIDITNFFGVTVYNFNGYIIPLLMKIAVLKAKNDFGVKLKLTYLVLGVFLLLGAVGLVLRVCGYIDI